MLSLFGLNTAFPVLALCFLSNHIELCSLIPKYTIILLDTFPLYKLHLCKLFPKPVLFSSLAWCDLLCICQDQTDMSLPCWQEAPSLPFPGIERGFTFIVLQKDIYHWTIVQLLVRSLTRSELHKVRVFFFHSNYFLWCLLHSVKALQLLIQLIFCFVSIKFIGFLNYYSFL